MWAVVETYYKHAEYELKIFDCEKLFKNYLEETLSFYRSEYDEDDEDDEDEEMTELHNMMKKVVRIGNKLVDDETGWGVREIREI
jgi:hypothetical protein